MQISKRIQPYEREFVDRDPEWKTYKKMAVQPSQCFFCIEAKDGFGKTWLLQHLAQAGKTISEREITSLYIDLEKPEAKNAEMLLRYIKSGTTGPVQTELAKVIDVIDAGVNIQAGGDVHIDGDVVGGNKVNIPDLGQPGSKSINVEVWDPAGYARNVDKLTAALVFGLAQLQPPAELVLMLDNFGETTTTHTREWLLGTLAPKLQNGQISNLIIVLTSKEPFQCFPSNDWKHVVVQWHLGGLPDEFIREYWVKIRGLQELHLQTIMPLLKSKEYSPAEMSAYADAIERSQD